MGKIAVALSGGVDSSVAAILLREQGYDLVGVFMKNWEDSVDASPYQTKTKTGCQWEDDFADVRAVCHLLDIPYLTFDFVTEYRNRVFASFLKELQAGRTPNPDILCNQEIKFNLFLKKALALPDVSAIATGHYAKIADGALWRPRDTVKDQTYFLYRMPLSALPRVHFPLHNLLKNEVREYARRAHLPNAEKKDSTGICFIGDIDYTKFLREHLHDQPGEIVTSDGVVIGHHRGLHLYTIGQRHGLNIGGTGPYFVVAKERTTQRLIISNQPNDSALFRRRCSVSDIAWLATPPSSSQFSALVQIRYRQSAQPAHVTLYNNNTCGIIHFEQPQRAITPGQSAVFYDNNRVLGGGIIEEPHNMP